MKQIFPSAVSWWLFAPLLVLLLGSTVFAGLEQSWLSGLTMLAALGFTIWLIRSTYYEVQPAQQLLRIVSGPLVWRVRVADITQVEKSHNLLSSPALSLDRLKIYYGKYDFVLISPADRAGFLAALLTLNPAIRHD
ncbi:PH domain-containing protein [Hymenobacter actinosclerus]|uniref:PH domain-containing protein n=1 Tax=Hymenobacter actinosclerus TaxID=82805 RepID=A0A1I0BGG7_9BACT|nr:PH domain-containing protein [Hymenobacter actinosclerus]SET05895.1 PH domain-containing protein [Hymenobacter actinosclerus]